HSTCRAVGRPGPVIVNHTAISRALGAGSAHSMRGGGRSSGLRPGAWHRGAGRHARAREGRMEYRELGKTGLRVSALGFGCGNVGGLIIREEPRTRVRAVARAIEAGINYFDTASMYGNGQS